jgi:single-strand DNA-binding protein
MQGLNKITLVGNLGKDPEINSIEGNIKVAKFTLATSESYKDPAGNRQTHTEWHAVVAWRGLADLAEKYLHKGSTVYVEGKLRTRNYENKEGQKVYVTEVQAEQIIMLDKKEEA